MSPQITIKKLPKARVECRAEFSAEESAAAEKRALEALSNSMNLPGFRPGKAPADMVKAKADPEALLEETVRVLLPDVMKAAIEEHKILPIIPPAAAIEKTDPLTMVLTLVERPKVSVKEGKINVEKKETKIEEKDIDRMIDSLMTEHQIATAVERAAKHGDRLMLDVRGEDVFLVQSMHSDQNLSVNDKICRFLFLLGAMRDGGAKRVVALIPYLAYARKDRRTKPHDPLPSRYGPQSRR